MLALFDLDGTLTDPYEGITASVSFALERLGLPALDSHGLRAFIGPPLHDQFAGLGLDELAVGRAVALYRERFADRGLYENYVYPGIPEALAVLAAAGVTLAVATSKPTEFATRILEHFELASHFAFIAGATLDGSRRHKSDIIAFALGKLGVAPAESVMIGDRAQDITGARVHGVRSIGITWGYADPDELEQAGADVVVRSTDELVAAVLGHMGQ